MACNVVFILLFSFAAWCCYYFFRRPLFAIQQQIRALSGSLKNYTNENIIYSFETLDAKLKQHPLAAVPWEKYKKNLARRKDEDIVRIYSTVEAEEYFNTPAFTGSVYLQFFSGMAGIFTGLGILGTFVGLTIGLYGIDTSSTAALQGGISGLLGGMNTAFLTSIVGIVLGIGFNIWYSRTMKAFAADVESVSAHFERIFTRRTVEEILMEQSSEAQAQTAILSQLGTDMASALCERLPDVLEGIADKLNESLKGDIQTLFDSLLDELHQLNGGAISAVADSFNNGAGREIAGFAKTLEKLSDGMEEILQKSQETSQDVNSQIQESLRQMLQEVRTSMSDSLSRQKDGMAETFTQNQQMMQDMQDTVMRLSASIEDIQHKSQEASEDANAKMQESLQNMLQQWQNSMSDSLSRQKDGLDANIAQNQQMMQDMRETMKSLSDSMGVLVGKSHSTMEAAAREMTENAKRQSDEARKSAQVMNESTEQALEALGQKIAQMQQAMADHENALRQILLSMEKAMTSSTTLVQNAGTAADSFRQAAGPVQTAVNTLSGHITQMVQATEKYGRQINDSTELIVTAADMNQKTLQNLQNVMTQTKNAWDAYEKHFDKVKEELSKTFEVLDDGMKRYNDATERGLNNKLQRFDETMGTAVGRLASITEESNESVEALTQAIANLKTSMTYVRR